MLLQFPIIFLWGLLTILAFIGWGEVANRLAGRPGDGIKVDWGLKAGWGMALALFIGGVGAFLGIATTTFAILFVLAGVVLQIATCKRPQISQISWGAFRNPHFLVLCVTGAIILIRYTAWTHNIVRNCNDDGLAYYPYIYRLLETGTLIEPFSFRRMASFGGQTFLQSLTVAVGSVDNGFMLDRGIAVIINFGLALGLFGSRHGVYYAFALLMTLFIPGPLVNSHSLYTGVAMFLTMYRTLTLIPDPDKARLRHLILVGAIMAGASSLRSNYAPVMAAIACFYWLFCYLKQGRPFSRYLVTLIQSGLAATVFLVPWMALMQISSGTPFYPIFQGNSQFGMDLLSAPITTAEHLGTFFDFLTSPAIFYFSPLLFLPWLRKHSAALALYAGAGAGAFILLFVFSHADNYGINRYTHPFVTAAFMCSLAVLFHDLRAKFSNTGKANDNPAQGGDFIFIAMVAALIPFNVLQDIERIQGSWGKTLNKPEFIVTYKNMQETIPQGARFLAMVDHPYFFDYARNQVNNIGIPGVTSIDPGMPFFKGEQALKDYLLSKSIHYIVFRDFETVFDCQSSSYNRSLWVKNKTSPHQAYRIQANYYFDIMDNFQALAASGRMLYDQNGLMAFEIP